MEGNFVNHKIFTKEGRPVVFSEKMMEKVKELIGHYPEGRQKSAILPVLHMAQEETGGYLSVDVMDAVAAMLNIQPIEVYEVATFYSMYSLEKTGRFVIELCRTGPCSISGGEHILEYLQEKLAIREGETTPDGLFTLRTVECLGACGYAPVMQVNSEYHEYLTPARIDRIIEELKEQATGENPEGTKWAEKF
jgi:NADH-quinone oxidoreductase subunit E